MVARSAKRDFWGETFVTAVEKNGTQKHFLHLFLHIRDMRKKMDRPFSYSPNMKNTIGIVFLLFTVGFLLPEFRAPYIVLVL